MGVGVPFRPYPTDLADGQVLTVLKVVKDLGQYETWGDRMILSSSTRATSLKDSAALARRIGYL